MKNCEEMSNTIPTTTADLYAVVDLTKKKANTNLERSKETNSETPIYHVLDREDSTSSNNYTESEDKASYSSDMYSKIDLGKKRNSSRNKVGQREQEMRSTKTKIDHHKLLKNNGKNRTHNCLVYFAIVAVIVSMIMIVAVMVIIFAVTYQKIDSLEESLRKTVNNNLNSSVEQIKMSIADDAPEKPFLYLDSFKSPCLEIRKSYSNFSDRYIVASPTGPLLSVYCDMNRTFGGNSTGWIRIAKLDVNNCPSGMQKKYINTMDTCVVTEDRAGCTEIHYSVYDIQYTMVTGRVHAYQIGNLDGFRAADEARTSPRTSNNLSSNYLDGVSITANGKHVWSFAAGCECNDEKPNFIGEKYICDGIVFKQGKPKSYYHNFLWENQQCQNSSSWFYSDLDSTTADIEVRICRDQERTDEDLGITAIELYIQ